MDKVLKFVGDILEFGERLDPVHWCIMSVCGVILGYICMQGMKIR